MGIAQSPIEVESYDDLDREIATVERGWEEHGQPLMAAFAALARAWDEHGEEAAATASRAADLHDAAGDGIEFVPGVSVMGTLEAMGEKLKSVNTEYFAGMDDDMLAAAKATETVNGEVEEVIAEAASAAARERSLMEDVADETGAKIHTERALA